MQIEKGYCIHSYSCLFECWKCNYRFTRLHFQFAVIYRCQTYTSSQRSDIWFIPAVWAVAASIGKLGGDPQHKINLVYLIESPILGKCFVLMVLVMQGKCRQLVISFSPWSTQDSEILFMTLFTTFNSTSHPTALLWSYSFSIQRHINYVIRCVLISMS